MKLRLLDKNLCHNESIVECPQHGTVQSPLARFCVECGTELSFGTEGKVPSQRELPYRDNTLVGYLELFFVCDASGMLHVLDAHLNDLAEPISCPDLLKDIAPSATEGYLYCASTQGWYAVDLVAWLQGRPLRATQVIRRKASVAFRFQAARFPRWRMLADQPN